jgi:thiol:disulfide interchange protein
MGAAMDDLALSIWQNSIWRHSEIASVVALIIFLVVIFFVWKAFPMSAYIAGVIFIAAFGISLYGSFVEQRYVHDKLVSMEQQKQTVSLSQGECQIKTVSDSDVTLDCNGSLVQMKLRDLPEKYKKR